MDQPRKATPGQKSRTTELGVFFLEWFLSHGSFSFWNLLPPSRTAKGHDTGRWATFVKFKESLCPVMLRSFVA